MLCIIIGKTQLSRSFFACMVSSQVHSLYELIFIHVSDMQCRFPGTLRLTRKGLIHGSRSVIPTLCTEARIPSQRVQSSLCQQSSKRPVCVYSLNVISTFNHRNISKNMGKPGIYESRSYSPRWKTQAEGRPRRGICRCVGVLQEL